MLKSAARLLLFAAFCGAPRPALPQEPEHVRIATFNIANFGDRDEYSRTLAGLVNVLRVADADVVALQEIQPSSLGHDQVRRLVRLLNIAALHDGTSPYDFEVSSVFTGDETTAFLWREPAFKTSDITLLPHDEDPDGDGLPTFQRVPALASFRAGSYDFLLVNVHLYTQVSGVTSEGRGAELDALAAWLRSTSGAEEKDVIVLGDMNRKLNGNVWSRIMTPDHAAHYRFPLLEAIARDQPGFNMLTGDPADDRHSTTTSGSTRVYDQVIISRGSEAEFVAAPVFGRDVGIVDFDNDPQHAWIVANWHHATSLMSDHRPVWIRMRIDGPDDD